MSWWAITLIAVGGAAVGGVVVYIGVTYWLGRSFTRNM